MEYRGFCSPFLIFWNSVRFSASRHTFLPSNTPMTPTLLFWGVSWPFKTSSETFHDYNQPSSKETSITLDIYLISYGSHSDNFDIYIYIYISSDLPTSLQKKSITTAHHVENQLFDVNPNEACLNVWSLSWYPWTLLLIVLILKYTFNILSAPSVTSEPFFLHSRRTK